nr:hypothetical protein [Micromonospora sp. DSM 115978]
MLVAFAFAVTVTVAGCSDSTAPSTRSSAAPLPAAPLPAAPVATPTVGVGPTAPPSPGPTKSQANRGVQVDARDLDGSWEGEYV